MSVLTLGALVTPAALASPGPAPAPATAVRGVLSTAPPGECRDRVRRELERGQREIEACAATRDALTRALLQAHPRRFGVVELREVSLIRVRLVVSEADRCQRWVLRSPRSLVVRPPEATRSGCRIRRFEGSLPVSLVRPDGSRVEADPIATDADGRGELRFAALDARLRGRGFDGLDAFARIEIGKGGFAGVVDMARLRNLIADWHYQWVAAGRGAPGLFEVRHPRHESAPAARALATEATLARQESDYLAVSRGELQPLVFLQRYVWSPYRASVMAMAFGEEVSGLPDDPAPGLAPESLPPGPAPEPPPPATPLPNASPDAGP